MSADALIHWRRIDAAGHDRCRLSPAGTGWTLDGTARFEHQGVAAALTYRAACNQAWISTGGWVTGSIGRRAIDYRIERSADGLWFMQGGPVAGLAGCVDLDFGFTPATNLFQLRRLRLQIGAARNAPVAWLDVDTGRLDLLRQLYERRTGCTYWYEAPRFDYAALLEVTPAGFIRKYPGLWESDID